MLQQLKPPSNSPRINVEETIAPEAKELLQLAEETRDHLKELKSLDEISLRLHRPISINDQRAAAQEVGFNSLGSLPAQERHLSSKSERLLVKSVGQLGRDIEHYDETIENAKTALSQGKNPAGDIAVAVSPKVRALDKLSETLSNQAGTAMLMYGAVGVLNSVGAIPGPLKWPAAAIVTGVQLFWLKSVFVDLYREYQTKKIRDQFPEK